LLSLLAVLALAGCRKPEADLGLDLLPGDPLGLQVDTFAIHAFTIADSAVRTSGLTRNLVGSYLDADFGLVRTGIVTQIRLSANNVGTGQSTAELVADSLVLALAFDGGNYAYGNLNPQVFEVYELAEDLSVDSVYESDAVPAVVDMDLVADRGGRLRPDPFTNPVLNGDTVVPQLRIRLSQDLARRFLDAFGSADLSDNTAFLQFFKGLYIRVNNGPQTLFQEGVLYFNLLSSASKATLYYRNVVTEPDVPRALDFLINQNCVRYTVAEFDRSQALNPGLDIAIADTITNATTTYIQALGGTRTVVQFPTLMDAAAQGRILAKAELEVPIKGTFHPYHAPPAQLFIFRKDSARADAFLPDQLNGLGAIGGNYLSSERAYRFNITRYVQAVLNGAIPNNGVQLVSGSSGVSVNRTLLAGPLDAAQPMRLRLTFTTY